QGRVPDYERVALSFLGKWAALYGEAIYETRPVPELKYSGRDFMLRKGSDYYYFTFDLDHLGDANVTKLARSTAFRGAYGFKDKVKKAYWLDDKSEVQFTQNAEAGLFGFYVAGFPYGMDTVVRVLKIETE
ncbi:MAG: hypothetical protein MJ025_06980, partial [Victivallaceae bacterium]|nr:hypothetical protein [Victivallaceae bacterium]